MHEEPWLVLVEDREGARYVSLPTSTILERHARPAVACKRCGTQPRSIFAAVRNAGFEQKCRKPKRRWLLGIA
jgi:hypothetical protein